MEFPDSSPARLNQHLVSRKKEFYPLTKDLKQYLGRYRRLKSRGVRYLDLSRYVESVPLYDEDGKDTLWASVIYQPNEQREIDHDLVVTYADLRGHGDLSIIQHLYVDRVDLCLYGNTLPYRVRIVNALNENFDYYYVKRTDANRIYGLELEHLLSPSRIQYYVRDETIIEDHIVGVPGDVFLQSAMPKNRFDLVRLAKQFVKFDTRCLFQLLGDMHAGNFVVDVTRDFEKHHYRFRPIDFDQQSHHRKIEVYRPQAYDRNALFVDAVRDVLPPASIAQYRKEERALMRHRVNVSDGRVHALLEVMKKDHIAEPKHVSILANSLGAFHGDEQFYGCSYMGELVYNSIMRLDYRPTDEEVRLLVDDDTDEDY
ncbi:MAG: hypothetical protein OXE59_07110 [Bacteroidetes bacterium]|nr:hypothetical protein [Bacteroidota bacterium]MCY4233490.1 hypothetical protein [Bacteroidota bacterium]